MEKRQGSYCSRWLTESLLFLNPHFAPVNLRKLISVSVRLPPTTPIEVCPFLARYSPYKTENFYALFGARKEAQPIAKQQKGRKARRQKAWKAGPYRPVHERKEHSHHRPADPPLSLIHIFRIIQEMRDATDNLYPAIAVWENVMGAFSTNDRMDFRAVLSLSLIHI